MEHYQIAQSKKYILCLSFRNVLQSLKSAVTKNKPTIEKYAACECIDISDNRVSVDFIKMSPM